MSAITRLFIGLVVVSPIVPARAQAREGQVQALPSITPMSTDRGRVFDRAAWSLTESPDGRFVAFVPHDDTIRVYDTRTRAAHGIPNAVVGATELAWSRRGGLISFVRREENGRRVFPWVVPVDPASGRATGPARQLSMQPIAPWDDAPSFSPDDRYVAFASYRADSGFVLVVPSNGGRERVLYAAPGSVTRVLVSSDGRWVYFTAAPPRPAANRAPGLVVYRVPFSGGRAERLVDRVVFLIGPSADGSQLAWYADGHPRAAGGAAIVIADSAGKPLGVIRDVNAQLKNWSSRPGILLGNKVEWTYSTRAVSLAGGAVRSLGAPGPSELPLAWSPDGRLLANASGAGAHAFLILSPTGDTVRRIDAPPVGRVLGQDGPPVWAPDGRWIAYRAASANGRRPASRLMLIDARTGVARTLVEKGQIGAIRWRADRQALRYVDESDQSCSLIEVTLSGTTTTLARSVATLGRSVARPMTDTTVLVAAIDSMYVVSSRGGFVRTLRRSRLERLAYIGGAVKQSPDGQWLAVIDPAEEQPRSGKHAIHLIPTNGGPARTLSFDLDRTIFDPYFAGDAIAFVGNPTGRGAGGHSTDLFTIPLAGGVPRNLTAADSLTDLDEVTVAGDGRTIAYQAELGPTQPTRLIDIDVSQVGPRKPNATKK